MRRTAWASWRARVAGIGMGVRDDVGLVDAREGHLEHVLEEARGAHREGPVRGRDEAPEPLHERGREPRARGSARGASRPPLSRVAEPRLVEGVGPEIVGLEEALEFVYSDEGGARDLDLESLAGSAGSPRSRRGP